mgnify:CR=1 FL=1
MLAVEPYLHHMTVVQHENTVRYMLHDAQACETMISAVDGLACRIAANAPGSAGEPAHRWRSSAHRRVSRPAR